MNGPPIGRPKNQSGEPSPAWTPDRPAEPEPPFQELSDADLTARELLEPYDPDLPPSRTQRRPLAAQPG